MNLHKQLQSLWGPQPSDFCRGSCKFCGVHSLPQQVHGAVLCCLRHCMLEADNVSLTAHHFCCTPVGSSSMLLGFFVSYLRQGVRPCVESCRSDSRW